MSESSIPLQDGPRKTKKVSIQERSVPVGEIIVVNGYRVNLALLKQRFAEGGYQIQETPHFLLLTRREVPSTIIVHWFAPEKLDADLKHYITRELKPLGSIPSSQRYGEIVSGIVGSFFPDDTRRAWRFFGENTLQRFLTFLATVYTPPLPDYATIGMFATLYQRVCELRLGDTFLDAGCASGFLPLLLSERIPFMQEIVGIDIQPEAFTVAQEMAEERRLTNVRFVQADLLAEDLYRLGRFDTVAVLHVLEHFSEADTNRVLKNLLKVTAKRLIVAVPYEHGDPETSYGHQQIFTHNKLDALGQWCLQNQLDGEGRIWLEDCVGGLLMIERGS